ncbi:hypothetical protein DDB_G0288027 [Dictyostelium discoideum AX4]|uniref:PROP1-like PPR domain-containing protein n=1 Tax=Dictyostelium discoideum TaxID=44689 RepID=Q54JI6_DICDI|nr:hypothetical protein DDB_G0288027 [Dictyostelium discoideum AX4]EAL63439.1 hypothetical protein DDB_G0288027 [Dictyostelium discoideum AX4]|eukprot:XP_636945.1 hypothetical protein DDB_G0288027 [Dictyostelium discoideum AX4]
MLNLNKSFKIINYSFLIKNVIRNYGSNKSIPTIITKPKENIKNINEIKETKIKIKNNNNNNDHSTENSLVVKKFNNSHIMERDPQDRSLSLKQYFEKLADRGDVDRMLQVARRMPERRTAYAYDKLIFACSKAHKFNQSWKIYNDMKKDNIKPSIHVFGNLVDICNHSTSIDSNKIQERVNKIIEEIDKYQVPVSINFFNILMKTMITIGNNDQAITMIDKMKDSGIRPDITSYTTWIKAISEKYLADNYLNKKELIKELNKPNKNTSEMDELRAEGNKQIDFYMTLVKKVKMAQISPDRYFINTILNACKQTKNPSGVFQVWDTLKEMRFTQHLNPDTKTYDILISTCNNIDDFDKSLEIFEEIFSKNIRPDIHLVNNMFRTCLRIASCRKISKKENLDEEIIINRIIDYMSAYSLQPNEESFSVLISTYSKLKNYVKVYELLLEMKELNISPNIKHYSGIISSFSKDTEKCLEILRICVSQKIVLTPDFISNVQKSISRHKGDVEQFSKLLREHDSYAIEKKIKNK